MNYKTFFDAARDCLFNGYLSKSQVSGMQTILDLWQNFPEPIEKQTPFANQWESVWKNRMLHQLAYILATSYHETSKNMSPVREFGNDAYLSKYDTGKLAVILGNTPEADGDGIVYAGRGDVQLTGKAQYEKMTIVLRNFFPDCPNFVELPDEMLKDNFSKATLIIGMMLGSYTGKALPQYVSGTPFSCNYKDARRVVNGTDKQDLIAEHAYKFLACLAVSA